MVRKVSEILAEEEAKGSAAPTLAKPVRKVADILAEEEKSSGKGFLGKVAEGAGNALAFVGRGIDRVSGAPLRAAITEVQDARDARGGRAEGLGKFLDPQEYADVGRAGLGYLKNFGVDPDKVPTGQQVMARQGLSEEGGSQVGTYSAEAGGYPNLSRPTENGKGMSPAAMAGLGLDTAAPIPGLGALKFGAKVGGVGARMVEGAAEGAAKVVDVASGTKIASKSVDVMSNGLNNLGEALKARYGSELAPDAQKFIATMNRNGIDPNKATASVMFGPTSSASHLERARAETPIGEVLRKQHQEVTTEVQEAIRKDIRRIGGETTGGDGKVIAAKIPDTAEKAGELITTAFDKRVDEILNGTKDTYTSLSGKAPGAKIPPEATKKLATHLAALEKHATDLAIDNFDDVTETQAKHLLTVVQKVRNGQGDLATTVRGLQGLGRSAFKTKYPLGSVPPDIKKLRELYGQISEAVIDGVETHFGAEVAGNLRANNKAISEMFKDNALIPALGNDAKSNDKLFRNLILQGDAKRIGIIKKYLTPEELQQTKAAALEILNKENIQGEFSFRNRLSQKLSDPDDALNALFDPGELDNLKDLFQLGDRMGKSVLSTSGTGGSIAHQAASWGDYVNPSKLLNKAEGGVDAIFEARQKGAVSRAVGFDMGEMPGRAAAQKPGQGPIMSFSPGGARTVETLRSFQPWRRGTRQFSTLGEDEDR